METHLRDWRLDVMNGRALTFLLIVACAAAAHAQQPAKRAPNIVMLLVDDLGWMDLRCQGNKAVETPHVDRFASQGMRFTDAGQLQKGGDAVSVGRKSAVCKGVSPCILYPPSIGCPASVQPRYPPPTTCA